MATKGHAAQLQKLEAKVEAIAAAIRCRKVVSIRRIRALKEMKTICSAHRLLVRIDELTAEVGKGMFLLFAPFMLEYLRRMCPAGSPLGDEELLALTREVARDWRFIRENRRLRLYHAEYKETPCADVQTHVRAGKTILCHCRYLGNQHLLDLPLGGESELLVRLVRSLAALHSYYEWPRGRTRMDTKSGR